MSRLPPTDISRLPASPDDPKYKALREYLTDSSKPAADRKALFKRQCEIDFWYFARFATSARHFVCEHEGCEHNGKNIFDHPFTFERCRALQEEPDGYLDLWPRAHFKTTIGTVYLTLWGFLHRPADTVAIITWELGEVGNSFVDTIQAELEPEEIPGHGVPRNQVLVAHWPEIFYADPARESKVWKRGSLNLKQHGGQKENSISAMSLNAIRTSQHFHIIVFDDIVTEKSSHSPEACQDCSTKFAKTTALRHSGAHTRVRGFGTRWASHDTYRKILDEGILKRRVGPEDCYFPPGHPKAGQSILHPGPKCRWLDEWRAQMRLTDTGMSDALFAANMRNQPLDEQSIHHFRPEWVHRRGYQASPESMAKGANLYAFVDPARPKSDSKGKKTDYIAIVVLALRADGKRYVIDLHRDRMDAVPATELIFDIDKKWRREGNPINYWWWELRGSSWDMAYWRQAMDHAGHRFEMLIYEDGDSKDQRIQRLMVPFERGEIILPETLHNMTDGGYVNMVQEFIQNEYLRWRPTSGSYNRVGVTARNEDMLDALAQSYSPEVKDYLQFPVADPSDEDPRAWALERSRAKANRHREAESKRPVWACVLAILACGLI